MGSQARWEALGTYVVVTTRSAAALDQARAVAEEVLADVDRTCSRFREDSDLSRANARAGQWTPVDPLLVAATRVALDAARLTGGLVDPLLGRQLCALGYDRDLAALEDRGPVPAVAPRPGSWAELGLADDALRVPGGTALDLGATGKAFAADLVAAVLAGELEHPAIVSVGGDVAVAGEAPWPVAVSERVGGPDEEVWIDRGGLATSSTRIRRWRRGGAEQHHLLDPRTGHPAAEAWTTVTCVGGSAAGANAASTAAIVLGHDAVDWLRDHEVTARLVAADGRVVRTGGWPAPQEAA